MYSIIIFYVLPSFWPNFVSAKQTSFTLDKTFPCCYSKCTQYANISQGKQNLWYFKLYHGLDFLQGLLNPPFFYKNMNI